LILEASHIGGNAAWIDHLENYPGFPFGVSGGELMDNFHKQAERFGCETRMEEVIKLESLPEGKKVTTYEGEYWPKRSSSPWEPNAENWKYPANRSSRAAAVPTVPLVTPHFLKTTRWRWGVAATQLSMKRCFFPESPPRYF
jgi:hypothetical protein